MRATITLEPVKAVVEYQYKHFAGVFDVGDKVEIEPIVTKYDYHKSFPVKPENTTPAGNYVNYRIKAKNGLYYNDQCIVNAIGYKTLNQIFKRI
jgi:hypothetical protein